MDQGYSPQEITDWLVANDAQGNPTIRQYGVVDLVDGGQSAAYTGSSNGWIQESFDLDAYAGQEVLLRFEYVTDDAVNRAGWLIDDVCIPEAGLCDDLESGAGDWEARGFIYSDNRVGQRYQVQVILVQDNALRVLQVPLDQAQQGRLELRGLGPRERAVLVISALAPVTTEQASYRYSVEPLSAP